MQRWIKLSQEWNSLSFLLICYFCCLAALEEGPMVTIRRGRQPTLNLWVHVVMAAFHFSFLPALLSRPHYQVMDCKRIIPKVWLERQLRTMAFGSHSRPIASLLIISHGKLRLSRFNEDKIDENEWNNEKKLSPKIMLKCSKFYVFIENIRKTPFSFWIITQKEMHK